MKTHALLLALCATAACTDRIGVTDPTAPDLTPKEFLFRVPIITPPGAIGASAPAPDRDAGVTHTVPLSHQFDEELPSDLRDIIEGRQGLITHPAEADVGFLPEEGVIFGQALGQSIGSWHRNTVTLTAFLENRPIAEAVGIESSGCANCFRFRNPHGKIANVTLPLQRSCGLAAQARAYLETKLEATHDKTVLLGSDEGTATKVASQPTCPPASGGGQFDEEKWYLCHWEAYYNDLGELVYQRDLGCVELGMA